LTLQNQPKTKQNKRPVKNYADFNRYGLGANSATDFVLGKDLLIELQKYELKFGIGDYVPFLSDDNYLISRIDFLSKSSPTLGAILASKANMIVGGGLNIYASPNQTIIKRLKKAFRKNIQDIDDIAGINEYLLNVDAGADFQDVLTRVARDYATYGNAFAQLIRYKEAGVEKLVLKHTPVAWARPKIVETGSIKKYIGVSSEFQTGQNEPTDTLDICMYPHFEPVETASGTYERSIIHLKDYQPNSYYWGLPDWISTNLYCEIEYRIARFNISQFENGFTPSAIVTMGGATTDPDETSKFVDYFVDSFTNTGNDSKVLFYMLENPDYNIDVNVLNQIKEGQFTELATIAAQQIITGCNWSAALAGIQTAGQLGSNQQLRTEFSKLQNMVINPIQSLFEKQLIAPVLREAAELGGFSFSGLGVELSKVNPISLAGDIMPNEVLTVNEQREVLGYEPIIEEPENETEDVDNNK